MTVLYVFLMVLMAVIMCLLPLALQFKNGINPEHFKKIKINALSFMFRGIGFKDGAYCSAKDYGVILPMFAIQVFGYVLAALTVILVPVIIFVAEIEVWQTVLIVLYMLIAEAVICIITALVCFIISRQKDKQPAGENSSQS